MCATMPQTALSRIDALERRGDALPYSAHGSVLRRFNRCGTVSSVHGPLPNLRHSNGMETMAPGRARGENAQMDVLILVFSN
jgi:hypothetical protein